jgi:hypothetical protein
MLHPLFLFAALLFSGNAFNISTVAGRPPGPAQIDGIGTQARFESIRAMTGHDGSLYVADNTSLRRVDIATRRVTTITRFAGNNVRSGLNFNTPGVKGIWTDGVYAYVTESSVGRIHRIDLNTGEVQIVPNLYSSCGTCAFSPGSQGVLFPTVQLGAPWGIWSDGSDLYIAESTAGKITKLNITSGRLSEFAKPLGPADPSRCTVGRFCIGYWVPSPRDIASDGSFLYVTGYSQAMRRIDIRSGEITDLPEFPFIPRDPSISAAILYVHDEDGQQIAAMDLATGSTRTVATDFTLPGLSKYGPMWADGGFLYVAHGDVRIDRINLQTGQSEIFVGGPIFGEAIDGTGVTATFNRAGDIWNDGPNLYITDDGQRLVRKFELSTAKVTTAAQLPASSTASTMRAIWGSGTEIFVADQDGLHKIDLSTGAQTLLVGSTALQLGVAIWGDGSSLYIADIRADAILRVNPTTGDVQTLPASTQVNSPAALWGQGTNLYVTSGRTIHRISLVTFERQQLAEFPSGLLGDIWGTGDTLWVRDYTGSLWKLSASTGAFERALNASGPDAGSPIQVYGPYGSGIWGIGADLYLSQADSIVKLTPADLQNVSTISVMDRGVTVKTTNSADAQLTLGHARVEGGGVSGLAIFSFRNNGVTVSEMSFPASAPTLSGRIFATLNTIVNTGIAIANQNPGTASVTFFFTNTEGREIKRDTITIPPGNQIARFINEAPFNLTTPFTGTLTFTSSVPVGAMALRGVVNERSEFLMTTLPAVPLAANPAGAAIIPHFATGGGWTTQVVLVNPTDQLVTGSIAFYSGGAIRETLTYTVQSRSSSVVIPTSGDTVVTGFVRITSDTNAGPPSGQVIFSYRAAGVTVTEAGVSSTPVTQVVRTYTDITSSSGFGVSNSRAIGFAIANPSSTNLTVTLQGTNMDGYPDGRLVRLIIPANGQRAFFTHELGLSSLDPGVLRVSTDSPSGISLIALRALYNERLDFLITTTAAIPENTVATDTVVFPHLVAGGGYTTDIVLMNASNQTVNNTVQYFSQFGAPLPLTFK